jgi:hypothetical protein
MDDRAVLEPTSRSTTRTAQVSSGIGVATFLVADLVADQLLRVPHQEAQVLGVTTDAGDFTLADFRRLPGRYRFLAFMPQWDFLDFVVGQARRLPSFELRTEAEALGVLEEAGRVTGLTWRDRAGAVHQVRARLTVAADGRTRGCAARPGCAPPSSACPSTWATSRRCVCAGRPPRPACPAVGEASRGEAEASNVHARQASSSRTGRANPLSGSSSSSTKRTPWGGAESATLWLTRTWPAPAWAAIRAARFTVRPK